MNIDERLLATYYGDGWTVDVYEEWDGGDNPFYDLFLRNPETNTSECINEGDVLYTVPTYDAVDQYVFNYLDGSGDYNACPGDVAARDSL